MDELRERIVRRLAAVVLEEGLMLFDDAEVPTIGPRSFLLAMPDGSTFRVGVDRQAAPGNPPLHYCGCGTAIDSRIGYCYECFRSGTTDRPAVDYPPHQENLP